jgi:hypothetical protein
MAVLRIVLNARVVGSLRRAAGRSLYSSGRSLRKVNSPFVVGPPEMRATTVYARLGS